MIAYGQNCLTTQTAVIWYVYPTRTSCDVRMGHVLSLTGRDLDGVPRGCRRGHDNTICLTSPSSRHKTLLSWLLLCRYPFKSMDVYVSRPSKARDGTHICLVLDGRRLL